MNYIAHIRESDKEEQSLKQHSLETKRLAEMFGESMNIKHIAGLATVLHDIGKATDTFFNYIREAANNYNTPPKRGSVIHSTTGGKLLYDLYHEDKKETPYKRLLTEIVGNTIISHHGYLKDFLGPDLTSPYLGRVRDENVPEEEYETAKRYFFSYVMKRSEFDKYVEKATEELKCFLEKEPPAYRERQLMFLTKLLFSILVDADRTNARLFEENEVWGVQENRTQLFSIYHERLLNGLDNLKKQKRKVRKSIQQLREEMSKQCEEFAKKPSGIYTLSIPTGGGKTLASLRYALQHAMKHNKKRIFYIVPYTTIIEQNAEEVRKILEDEENILEHHSNVAEEWKKDDEPIDGIMTAQQKLNLAKDNWEHPVIFTTMAQFLNTFYAKSSRSIRRLHHLSDSVIVFDEVQKVPVSCVSLFNQALNFLHTYANSTLVLCTATQPALDFVEHKLNIHTEGEMIQRLEDIVHAFRRVEIADLTETPFYNSVLASFVQKEIQNANSVLVILNTKTVVRNLYRLLKQQTDVFVYHLSTTMCAAHRKNILDKVKQHLKDEVKVVCISTQLIEAGVDISFQCVIRSLAGLDSIAQGAGRGNRHGENELQNVYIIDHAEEELELLREIQIGKKVAKKILRDIQRNPEAYGGQILSPQAMERYFQEYYTEMRLTLDYFVKKLGINMTELLSAPPKRNPYFHAYSQKNGKRLPLFLANSYGTAAEHFRPIDNNTTAVIIPYGNGKEVIARLNNGMSISDFTKLLRDAQPYVVHVYENELQQLVQNDRLSSYGDGQLFVLHEEAYHDECGIDIG